MFFPLVSLLVRAMISFGCLTLLRKPRIVVAVLSALHLMLSHFWLTTILNSVILLRPMAIRSTYHQQTLLDHAVSRQILKSIDTHDILHLYSHKDCALCREVKQRRHYTRPVPVEKQNRVNWNLGF